MNEHYEFMVHLSTLAVTLYPHFILYWQKSMGRRPKCGALTAVSIFLRNKLTYEFLSDLAAFARSVGFETTWLWLHRRFVDNLTLMDIMATSADDPDFLCRCQMTHADCPSFGRLCWELMVYARENLLEFDELQKHGGDIQPFTKGRALFAKRAEELNLRLSEVCIESSLAAAFMLADRQRRKGDYIPNR